MIRIWLRLSKAKSNATNSSAISHHESEAWTTNIRQRLREATSRLPFAENHRARGNVNGATGTELFRHREKPAKSASEPTTTSNLWSPSIQNCPRNCGTILSSRRNISDIGDWLAESEGFEPSGTGSPFVRFIRRTSGWVFGQTLPSTQQRGCWQRVRSKNIADIDCDR